MVLEIPGKLLGQDDVRETPVSTATATSVGLVDGKYLVVDYHTDMTDERKITAGEGIDFTDGGANSTFTIDGEDATTTNKGIASFDTNHFTLSSGAVSINNTVITAINDNTTHRGADGSDHSLLANKTSYVSIHGGAFVTKSDTESINREQDDIGTMFFGGAVDVQAEVQLPHGAVVTACEVYGGSTGSAADWNLYLKTLADGVSDGNVTSMATAALGTADSSISSATIDNSTNSYFIHVNGQGAAEVWIVGAKITYTTDYI